MPHVSINRIPDQEKAASVLLSQAEQNFENIQRRAFGYFQQRGQRQGNDLGDWLRAEREVVWKPHSEMVENDFAVVLRVAVPGFDIKAIQITAAPYCLVIQGTAAHSHQGLESRVRFCEFGQRLFRCFDLDARIDPKTVAATLDRGILEIVANKVHQPVP